MRIRTVRPWSSLPRMTPGFIEPLYQPVYQRRIRGVDPNMLHEFLLIGTQTAQSPPEVAVFCHDERVMAIEAAAWLGGRPDRKVETYRRADGTGMFELWQGEP